MRGFRISVNRTGVGSLVGRSVEGLGGVHCGLIEGWPPTERKKSSGN